MKVDNTPSPGGQSHQQTAKHLQTYNSKHELFEKVRFEIDVLEIFFCRRLFVLDNSCVFTTQNA